MLGYDEIIKLETTYGKVIITIPGDIDGITFGIDVGTGMVYLYGSFDDSNGGKIEVFLLIYSLGSTYGKVILFD